MVILDLSKVVMYNYFYDEIKPKYGDDVTVCATDTDSLLMEIKTRDVYRDMMDYKRPIMTKIISCTMKPTKLELFKDETKGLHILHNIWVYQVLFVTFCVIHLSNLHKKW
jgi:hypothetical protein